jgi:gluconate 2-dehydrogenase gamma chain
MRFRLRTRRQVLADAGKAGIALAVAPPLWLSAARSGVLSADELRTLRAAVARIIPADGPGDWSAADVGADGYIVALLSGRGRIYAGGPYRRQFSHFQRLSRVKQIGWSREVRQLRKLYRQGVAQLNSLAGGDFAAAPAALQDVILEGIDVAGNEFFAALYNHTMEGVYAHPVYGGNKNYRAWKAFGYAGDVHGVRFPHIGPPDAPWNKYGGYAPSEMAKPGKASP